MSLRRKTLTSTLCLVMLAPLNACGFYGAYHASELARDAQSERVVASSPDVLSWSAESFDQLEGGVILESLASNRSSWSVETVRVMVASAAEQDGEIVALTETGPDTGVFKGTIALERLYDAAGGRRTLERNGKLAVYAEGNVSAERLLAIHQGLAGRIRAIGAYVEPSSTLSETVDAADAPAGAEVSLSQETGWQASTSLRADGSYAFYDVPPGRFTLRVTGHEGVRESQVVRLP